MAAILLALASSLGYGGADFAGGLASRDAHVLRVVAAAAPFLDYVRSVRSTLSDYCCEIVECVTEEDRAFARMRFSGRHTAPFRGFAPTGREVSWAAAALFRVSDGVIEDVWVLGDLAGLDTLLAGQTA